MSANPSCVLISLNNQYQKQGENSPQMSTEHRAILDAVKQSIAELDAIYPPRFKLFPSRYEVWYKVAA